MAVGRRIFAFQDCVLPSFTVMQITKIQIYVDFWTLHSLLLDICLPTFLFTVPLLLFKVMTPAWSSILSHPAANTWNPYRKIESFAELDEHKCQNSCYPCEDWNGQKWYNQIRPIRLILHLPVLHAFYSLNKGQLKILDIQASKPDNPTLLYSCRKCLLDNNCFQISLQKQGWPHRAALPHSGDSPHVRGLGALCFADIYIYICQYLNTAPWPHKHNPSVLQLPEQSQPCCRRLCRGAGPAEGAQARAPALLQSPRSSHSTAGTAHRQPAPTAASKEAQKETKKKSTSSSGCQMSKELKKPTQTESNVTLGITQSILQISEHNIKKMSKTMEWDLWVLFRVDKQDHL